MDFSSNLQQGCHSQGKVRGKTNFSRSGNFLKSQGKSLILRGIEWSIENNASRKISAQSQSLGILIKSLGISILAKPVKSQGIPFSSL